MNLTTHLSRTALVATLGLGLGLAAPNLASAERGQGSSVDQADGKRHWGHGKRGHGCRGKRGKGHMYRALAELELTANQQAQVDAIRETAREQKRELRRQGRSEDSRQQYREIRREARALIMDVLTPEQREQLAQIREARRAEKLDRKVEWMTERLELSADQQRRIRAALENAQTRRAALREGTEDRDARREAMRAVRSETRDAIRAVLTPAQAQTLAEARENRRGKHGKHGKRGKRGKR
jgi:Spy/CpxP family protein refolding chaperone